MEKGRKGLRGRIRGLSPGLITLITLIEIHLIHGSMTITRSTDPLIEETSYRAREQE